MKKAGKALCIFTFILLTVFFCGCDKEIWNKDLDTGLSIKAADFPKLDGSVTMSNLSKLLYKNITGEGAVETENAVSHTGTQSAVKRLLSGEADIAFVYEPSMLDITLTEKIEDALEMRAIATDALAFYVSPQNRIEKLTQAQLQGIYTGYITNFSDVGGDDIKITPFQQPETSAAQTIMINSLMYNSDIMAPPSDKIFDALGNEETVLLDYDGGDGAVGYALYYYMKHMYKGEKCKLLKIGQIDCNEKNIASGEYPLTGKIYVAIRKDAATNGEARKIFDYITCEKGTEAIIAAGYVPYSEDVQALG